MIGNEKGNAGENIACAYLENQNYKILDRNYHSCYGEIDLIAQKGDYIIFCEVKLRRKNSRVSALQSVSPSKQKKIIMTSALYLQEKSYELQPRYDVIALTECVSGDFSVEHIKNAFDAQDVFY